MIFTEWNWDDALEVRGEERYARGLKEGQLKKNIGRYSEVDENNEFIC